VVNEAVLIRTALDYFNIDGEDSVDLSVSLGYWFNDQVLGAIGGSYDFDSEDAIGGVGLIFKL
jgi:hypothetical protein